MTEKRGLEISFRFNFFEMNRSESSSFNELFGKISKLKTVKCRFAHERVRMNKETGLPVPEIIAEAGFQRIGFCRPEIRSERLSCGHTMARYLLEEALAAISSEGKNTESLTAELRDLTDQIHHLDRQKGDADKRLAKLFEKKHFQPETNLTADFEAANTSIRNIERRHDECVERMSRLRDAVISEMKAIIEDENRRLTQTGNPS